jgi:hypothetical protein
MAETPPPYGYGPKKKSSTTTVVFVILGVCAVCCILGVAGIAAAGYFGFKKSQGAIACTIGFKEAGKALESYAIAHNGKLPDAAKWQEQIRPYFTNEIAKEDEKDKSTKMFGSFDPNGVWVCKDDSGGGMNTGIAFNSDYSGQSIADIKTKSTATILYETPKTGMNLNAPYSELTDSSSPKIFGSPRGWLRINGNFEVAGGNGNPKFRVH